MIRPIDIVHSRITLTVCVGFSSLVTLLTMSCKHEDSVADPWGPVSECIVDVAVDYQSMIAVADSADVRIVFQQFVEHSQVDSLPIFGGTNNWRFDSTSPHGTYRNVRYWKVHASRYSDDQQRWVRQEVFDVSQAGAVVRLLGCI